jgi:two-component system chemotaxis response regulator CheY
VKKILVVDDSELLHRMYEIILLKYRKSGTEVHHAFSGKEALGKLNEHPDVSLILLDINMPVMSGLEFLQYCRSEQCLRDIPVIIISTQGKEYDTILGLQAGAKAYLTKPFQSANLYKLIDQMFLPMTQVGP